MLDRRRDIRGVLESFASWFRRWYWALLPGMGLFVSLSVGVLLSHHLATASAIPLLEQAAQISDPKDRVTAIKEISQYQIDNQIKIWTGLVQAAGVVVLSVGGYFTWRNLRVGQETLRATQQKLDVDRDGQMSNRFTQAVAQLGSELKDGQPNIDIRLGGIYALERLSRDSPSDRSTIIEVLAAYVRQNAPFRRDDSSERTRSPKLRADIQSILTVLGRRTLSHEESENQRLDLTQTDLRRAHLPDAHFEGALLMWTNLEGSFLDGIHLEKASLRGAHLERTQLFAAHLEEAFLFEAHFEGAMFQWAHLERAGLAAAHLQGAFLATAHLEGAQLPLAHLEGANLEATLLQGANLEEANLKRAYLKRANLEGANLRRANLEGANLEDANLEGADLEGVLNLTREQLQLARDGGRGAHLPIDLMNPQSLPTSQPAPTASDLPPALPDHLDGGPDK